MRVLYAQRTEIANRRNNSSNAAVTIRRESMLHYENVQSRDGENA